jgi:hypothetical protein
MASPTPLGLTAADLSSAAVLDELAALAALMSLGTDEASLPPSPWLADVAGTATATATAGEASATAQRAWLATALAADDAADEGPARHIPVPVGDLPPEVRLRPAGDAPASGEGAGERGGSKGGEGSGVVTPASPGVAAPAAASDEVMGPEPSRETRTPAAPRAAPPTASVAEKVAIRELLTAMRVEAATAEQVMRALGEEDSAGAEADAARSGGAGDAGGGGGATLHAELTRGPDGKMHVVVGDASVAGSPLDAAAAVGSKRSRAAGRNGVSAASGRGEGGAGGVPAAGGGGEGEHGRWHTGDLDGGGGGGGGEAGDADSDDGVVVDAAAEEEADGERAMAAALEAEAALSPADRDRLLAATVAQIAAAGRAATLAALSAPARVSGGAADAAGFVIGGEGEGGGEGERGGRGPRRLFAAPRAAPPVDDSTGSSRKRE